MMSYSRFHLKPHCRHALFSIILAACIAINLRLCACVYGHMGNRSVYRYTYIIHIYTYGVTCVEY